MERHQTTLWPADSMAISPEYYLRQHFGFPVALVKQLYPILGREETLKTLYVRVVDGQESEDIRRVHARLEEHGIHRSHGTAAWRVSVGLQDDSHGPLDL